MARLPRNTDPEYIRLVTIRTENAQLRLIPEPRVVKLIGGVVAKYQEEFNIEIFAYNFLSNHKHLLVRAPQRNLWRFEQAVNREIAKRVNHLQKCRGHFWEKRYDEQITPEESDSLEALLYVVCNAVSHGLVEHPRSWPGLHCYHQLLNGKERKFQFVNYTKYRQAKLLARFAGKGVRITDYVTEHVLSLSVLPELEGLAKQQRSEYLSKLIEERVESIKAERFREGKGFLGRKAIFKQSPFSYPREVKRYPRPICYTKSFVVKKRFSEWFFPWLEAYQEASRRFRMGEYEVEFPPHCLRPPYHYALSP